MNYNKIEIIHEGEDYITVRVGKTEHEITYPAASIIKTLCERLDSAKGELQAIVHEDCC